MVFEEIHLSSRSTQHQMQTQTKLETGQACCSTDLDEDHVCDAKVPMKLACESLPNALAQRVILVLLANTRRTYRIVLRMRKRERALDVRDSFPARANPIFHTLCDLRETHQPGKALQALDKNDCNNTLVRALSVCVTVCCVCVACVCVCGGGVACCVCVCVCFVCLLCCVRSGRCGRYARDRDVLERAHVCAYAAMTHTRSPKALRCKECRRRRPHRERMQTLVIRPRYSERFLGYTVYGNGIRSCGTHTH